MQRRDFVKGLAAAAAVVQVLPEASEALEQQVERLRADVGAAIDDVHLWRRVRREFSLNPGVVHFNCGSSGATPRMVVDAMCNYMRRCESDPYDEVFGKGLAQGQAAVQEQAAEFLGAAADEMVLTRNTT